MEGPAGHSLPLLAPWEDLPCNVGAKTSYLICAACRPNIPPPPVLTPAGAKFMKSNTDFLLPSGSCSPDPPCSSGASTRRVFMQRSPTQEPVQSPPKYLCEVKLLAGEWGRGTKGKGDGAREGPAGAGWLPPGGNGQFSEMVFGTSFTPEHKIYKTTGHGVREGTDLSRPNPSGHAGNLLAWSGRSTDHFFRHSCSSEFVEQDWIPTCS
jgi:hypothetical protein